MTIAALEDTAEVVSRVAFPSTPGDVTRVAFTSAPGDVTVTLEVTSGTLMLNESVANGLTEPQLIFNGTKKITFSADVTMVNTTLADLAGLTYMPNADFNRNDTLKITIDNGTSSEERVIPITIEAVNDTPSFTLPANANQLVVAIAPADLVQTVAGFATNIKPGPATAVDEVGQVVDFLQITTDNDALFTSVPVIDATTGTLTYTLAPLAPNTRGVATVSVRLHDNGGGADTSPAQTFTITAVGPVNAVYNSVAGAKLQAFVVNGLLTVQINGIPYPTYSLGEIVTLTINGGSKNDEVNLTGLSLANYPNLTTIVINGNSGKDKLTGSADFAESILGGRGNDTLQGGGGDDTLEGGAGNDAISGQAGNDLLLGGAGKDTLIGGVGDDILNGGAGNDLLIGGFDEDVIDGGSGRDTAVGGQGGSAREGDGVNDGDDITAEVINEAFKKLFAFE